MASMINEQELSKHLLEKLNAEMSLAAEPIIQKALKEVEVVMRKRMASMLIGYLEQSMSIEHMGTDLRIIIKQGS